MLCLPHCARAREEYTRAAELYGELLKHPQEYSWPRQKTVHTAMTALYSRKGLKWSGGRIGPVTLSAELGVHTPTTT